MTGDGATIRRACAADVEAIVAMLADDPVAATRESPGDPAYDAAFARIDADQNELLLVAVDGQQVVGTLQLSLLSGLARRGALRAQIESVRVAAPRRGHGLGTNLVRYAIDEARHRGAALIQLTSDRSRGDAHRFYERLGFVASHEGFKLPLG